MHNILLQVKILLVKHKCSCNHFGIYYILTKPAAAVILKGDVEVAFWLENTKPQKERLTVLLVVSLSDVMPSVRKASKRVEWTFTRPSHEHYPVPSSCAGFA